MAGRPARRVVATVLFTDIVDSSRIAAETGDRGWKALLARHHEIVRRELRRHRGRELDTAGDGFFASFETQDDAIRCAAAIVERVQDIGVDVRAGIHAGQADVVGSKLGGVAVHIGARVMALGGSADILVTSVVRDLVSGSGFEFADFGQHALKGLPGEWRINRVTAVDGPLPPPLDRDEAARRRAAVFDEPVPHGRRRALLAGIATAALAVAAIAAVVARTTHGAPLRKPAAAPPHVLLKLDPRTGRVEASIPIGAPAPQHNDLGPAERLAHGVAVGEGSVWVTNENADTITRVDPVTNRVTATIHARSPDDVAVVPGAVWVSGDGTPAVWVDPGTNAALEIPLSTGVVEGQSVAADTATGSAYVAAGCSICSAPGTGVHVERIARSTEPTGTIAIASEYDVAGATVADGSLWVSAGTHLYRFGLERGNRQAAVNIGGQPGRVAADPSGGSVWVTDVSSGTQAGEAVQVDPSTDHVVNRQPIGCCPGAIAVGYGYVWVTNSRLGDVQRISTLTGEVSASIHLARAGSVVSNGDYSFSAYGVDGIAVGEGAIWVTLDRTA